jgi:hypothetical protein
MPEKVLESGRTIRARARQEIDDAGDFNAATREIVRAIRAALVAAGRALAGGHEGNVPGRGRKAARRAISVRSVKSNGDEEVPVHGDFALTEDGDLVVNVFVKPRGYSARCDSGLTTLGRPNA